MQTVMPDPRALLAQLFRTAVAASNPAFGLSHVLPRVLSQAQAGRTLVIGAGKAAAAMAEALEALWPGPLTGLIVGPHGTTASLRHLTYVTAAHPLPDAAGLHAAEALLQMVKGLSNGDLVIALISGGGSALLPAPAFGLTLEDEIDLNNALLKSGAPIRVMNAIRKQASRIKGGRLALAAAPARVISFIVSDVPGDDPALVASGPTIADTVGADQALRYVRDYGITLPPKLMQVLYAAPPPPMADNKVFARNETYVLASSASSLAAAAAEAQCLGLAVHCLSDAIEGEAKDIGRMHGAIACAVADGGQPFKPPCLILSGGETSVTLRHDRPGRGGRNGEFLLGLAGVIKGRSTIHCLAGDTDGIDGSGDNAGGFADGGSVLRIRAAGSDVEALLRGHNSYAGLHMAGDLFVTGPTGTNVNDFRAMLITGQS